MHASRVLSSALVVGVAVGITIIACGGGGSHNNQPDAKVFHDAKVPMDAPAGLMGLGHKCASATDCPTNAPECIGPSGSTQTWCTPVCDMSGSGTSNGSGQLPLSAIMPAPSDSTCAGAYMGTVGTPACLALLAATPMPNNQGLFPPNTRVTGIKMDCLVLCGTGSGSGPCPPSMSCNGGICLPN